MSETEQERLERLSRMKREEFENLEQAIEKYQKTEKYQIDSDEQARIVRHLLRFSKEELKEFLEQYGQDKLNFPDKHFVSALGLVAQRPKIELIKNLLEAGMDPNARNEDNKTVLHVIPYKHLAIISMLLEKGADPNITDKNGRAAIHFAARGGNAEVVSLVASKADCRVKDKQGNTALHSAAFSRLSGNRELVSVLIQNGLDPNQINLKGQTPLQIASYNNKEMRDILIPVTKLSLGLGVKLNLLILVDRIKNIFSSNSIKLKPANQFNKSLSEPVIQENREYNISSSYVTDVEEPEASSPAPSTSRKKDKRTGRGGLS